MKPAGTSRFERVVLGIVTALAWVGLLLQADISFHRMLAMGLAVSDVLIRFFSYFTILTNSFIALYGTWGLLSGKRRGTPSNLHASLVSGLTVSIFFVAVSYTILLRPLLHLSGTALLANTLLHYIVPTVFLLYWALFVSQTKVPWTHAGGWLLYPVLYFLYALMQGWRTGLYPYPFLDAARIGYAHVLVNGIALLAFFGFSGLALIGVSRQLQRRQHAD